MKFSFREQKINFTMVLFLSPLFATTLLGKPVLAQQTSQSDKFFAYINYTIVSSVTSTVRVAFGFVPVNAEIQQNYQAYNNSTTTNYQGAYQWLEIELARAYTNTAVIRGSISSGLFQINFDYFLEKPIIASKNINYKLFSKSVNVARINNDKSVKNLEEIDKNLNTFTENFEGFVSILKSFLSPDKQATISDINILIESANNLRKSTYIVGEDMKNISKQVSSEKDLIAVKDMVKSLETVTLLLENLTPQLNQIHLAISTSD
ncbi:hypothetical protein [Dolichospermum circinale]|uniref:hypothetical protein n=1 Tax=Dolichospermum circinale TaxID=109265 RepID=UPI0003F6A16C|nr:hypothetical protein [Dolichospermum circinale]MDB9473013.1 hypothetical protein [Dolichospermum circinale CS-537/11]MDB9478039.1 hypothetical protein [Dolichospermum circinale CS-537/03]MDB9483686.1 hypothetical protein [Dolichospermum circinale CS-537/05]